jgi:signal transduction histidine kinase
MKPLRSYPIQRKLRLVILATCTAALCVASSALFALQYFRFQRDYRLDIELRAELFGGLIAKMLSDRTRVEPGNVLEVLEKDPRIVGALFEPAGDGEAMEYGAADDAVRAAASLKSGFRSVGGELIYVSGIQRGPARIGTLVLKTDYRSQAIKLHGLYASILVIVLASSFLVAVVVSSRLERVISDPIQALADTARSIVHKGDYSLRAKKEADDEVGAFADTFNAMLNQIESREQALKHEIAERIRAEEELHRVHQQLMDASRHAGMAEVATGVLHNVGNVLNSVNVSATLIAEKLGSVRAANLARAVRLICAHQGSLADFLIRDPKGHLLPDYLKDATEQLAEERGEMLGEMMLLNRNLEHIKEIVARQQSYARVSGVIEALPLEELIEDAMRINSAALDRHRISVVRDFHPVPAAAVDKHKVLQILVNLIRNAKYAIDEGAGPVRLLTIGLRSVDGDRAVIEVSDTGVGIPEQNLTRIFSHGFTTRKDGHGFGLHSAALAASQMGGKLTAFSRGAGCGATFTLDLPIAGIPRHASNGAEPKPTSAALIA